MPEGAEGSAASRVLLVKHARPEIVPTVPAPQWRLSDAGRAECAELSDRLSAHGVDAVVASHEPKATETGRWVAARMHVPFSVGADLHEQTRLSAPFFADPADFEDAVRTVLRRPDELVLGEESGAQALDRFAAAIDRERAGLPADASLAVVSHGTVIALYVAARTGCDPVELWESLDFGSITALTL